MQVQKRFDISSAGLHILAMVFMLCDHLWATVVPGNQWLNSIGRLAFPIFAFLIVEGYFHTKSLRRYVLRLLVFAVLSEIPFNLMYGSSWLYPIHQNVLWTLLLGLGLIHWNERVREKKLWLRLVIGALTTLLGFVAGFLGMLDYYGVGVVTVLVFYFFRKRTWWRIAALIASLYYLNTEVLGGLGFEVTILGQTHFITQQSFALLALIPILLYRGRKGHRSKAFQYFCYLFYPVHMLILYALRAVVG